MEVKCTNYPVFIVSTELWGWSQYYIHVKSCTTTSNLFSILVACSDTITFNISTCKYIIQITRT